MLKNILKKYSHLIINLLLLGIVLYGVGRLYFYYTAGFTISNISADLNQEPNHEIPPLTISQKEELQMILSQPFYYLGKGCQSYVFKSEDKKYVIKFLKYQRFRPQNYLNVLSFLPVINDYREKKAIVKRKKLDDLLESWKIAYLNLKNETGLEYLHLNKTHEWDFPLKIVDKMGFKHSVNANETVFLIQKSAKMLCPTIIENEQKNNSDANKKLIDNLLTTLLSEYQRGLGDKDHALMQNTGVLENHPIHIDVGQFAKDENFKNPEVYKNEIFSKTYKFRIWLSKRYPELERYLASLLYEIIGDDIYQMKPHLKTVDEGV